MNTWPESKQKNYLCAEESCGASPLLLTFKEEILNYPKSLLDMSRELGELYEIKEIDLETCLYRNFDNGFDVEISGICSRKRKVNRKIIIWLWWIGSKQNKTVNAQIIRHVVDIPYDSHAIHSVTEKLYQYSNRLLAEGCNVNDIIQVNPDRFTYSEYIGL